jgi:hypothetical protein
LPQIPNPLLAQLRVFLNTIDATIEVDNPQVPPLQRSNDTYIMDWVIKFGNFSPAQIKRINYCRLYFNVVTVADISNVAGTHVEAYYWWAKANEHPLGKHKLGYLRLQERPKSVDSWVLWRKALKLFAPHQLTTRNLILL